MKEWKVRFGLMVGAAVLTGGLLAVTTVSAQNNNANPFTQVLNKLDEIIGKLNNAGSGETNYTQRWDRALPAGARFTILAAFYNQAVLDNNTGLVWEQSPAVTTANFQDSTYACANKVIGGQKGWRLPAVPELGSLVDVLAVSPGPAVQPGHPFANVQSTYYWSATTHAVTPVTAWTLDFSTGSFGSDNKMGGNHLAWCVRGPMNADTY